MQCCFNIRILHTTILLCTIFWIKSKYKYINGYSIRNGIVLVEKVDMLFALGNLAY